jgi:hypothetical protein
MKTIITNENLYFELIEEVNLNNVKNVTKNSFYANITIEFKTGQIKEIDGEFGYEDYKEEFGFIFIK